MSTIIPNAMNENFIKIGKCPIIPPLPSFNIASFEGHWYEVSSSFYIPTENSVCVSASISSKPDSPSDMIMLVKDRNNNFKGPVSGVRILLTKDENQEKASWNSKVFKRGSLTEFQNLPEESLPKFNILDTDYTNYSIAYSCQQWNKQLYSDVIWMFSRRFDNIQEDVDNIMEKLKKHVPYLNEYKFNITEHSTECYDQDYISGPNENTSISGQ